MLKPEQVPDEVVDALLDTSNVAKPWKDAVAAAINAWPGMEEHVNWPRLKLTHITIPIPQGAGADWTADWTYPKKGERRPVGDVLVARICRGGPEQRLWQAMYGTPEDEPQPTVTVAHWHKGRQKWVHGPRDEQVHGVYAWMPLPAPPTEASDELRERLHDQLDA